MLQKKLYDLSAEYVNTLKTLPHRPEGWLPHTVYVEEEGDYPVFTRYNLTDIRNDGSCTLVNPDTSEVFTNRHLSEINIEWLDTVLAWYYNCCSEQGITSNAV